MERLAHRKAGPIGREMANQQNAEKSDKIDGANERAAAAAYIAELSANLASIARQHGLDTLSYVLDMARLEAEQAVRHSDVRR